MERNNHDSHSLPATSFLAQLSPEIIEAGNAIAETVQSSRAADGNEVSIRLDQPLADAVEELEAAMIRRSLELHGGQVGTTAEEMGISRKGLYLKRQKLGLTDAH